MKKIKLLLLVALVTITLPLGVNAASKKNVYIFKGATCGYCKKALAFFQELVNDKNYADKFDLIEYEVWNNTENSKLGKAVAEELDEEMDGVPYIVIGDKTFSGYTSSYDDQIKAAIDEFYEDDDAVSVVETVRNSGEHFNVTPEYTLEKKEEKGNADAIIAVVIIVIAVGGFGYVVYLSRKDTTSKYYEKPVKKETKKEEVKEEKVEEKPATKTTAKKTTNTKKSTTAKKTTTTKKSGTKKTTTKKK